MILEGFQCKMARGKDSFSEKTNLMFLATSKHFKSGERIIRGNFSFKVGANLLSVGMELLPKELYFQIVGGGNDTQISGPRIYLSSLPLHSTNAQPPLGDTGLWWLPLPGDISFCSCSGEGQGDSQLPSGLGASCPTPAAEAAPQGASKCLVRALLSPLGMIKNKIQSKTTTKTPKKPLHNMIKQKKSNAKSTELGSYLTSASYTILEGCSAYTTLSFL